MRDVLNDKLFWTVQVIGAYEGADSEDFDTEDELPVYGISGGGVKPFSVIFLETIRDRTFHVSAANPQTFGGDDPAIRAMILERRTVVHEVAHSLIGGHTGIPGDASETTIMGPTTNAFGTDEQNRFTSKQIGIMQMRERPKTGQ